MGAGAYMTLKNWTTRPVTVTVDNISNFSDKASPSQLDGTIQPGGLAGRVYVETDGILTSTCTIQFSFGDNNQAIGSIGISEEGSYSIDSNTAPGNLVLTFFNAGNGSNLKQAYFGVSILETEFSWGNWMTTTPNLGELPLCQVCVPGSHDSGAYTLQSITDDSGLGIFGDLIPGTVLTQTLPVGGAPKSQLLFGCRFFDIRPGGTLPNTDLFTNPLFHIHSPDTQTVLACADFSEILTEINTYAQENPKEIIFLSLSHYTTSNTGSFNFKNPYTGQLENRSAVFSNKFLAVSRTYDQLSKVMLPSTVNPTTRLSDIWSNYPGKNVVVFLDTSDGIVIGTGSGNIQIPSKNGLPSGETVFWQTNGSQLVRGIGDYADTDSVTDLITWISGHIPAKGSTFNMLQTQLTAQTSDIVADSVAVASGNPILYDNRTAAVGSNAAVQALVNPVVTPGGEQSGEFASGVNFFICDVFDGSTTNLALAANLTRIANPSS